MVLSIEDISIYFIAGGKIGVRRLGEF